MQTRLQSPSPFSPQSLRLTLYAGIALVVVSMLFLGRDIDSSPLLLQIGYAVLTPALFYGVGAMVYRHLDAPLAAPGIVATGAWLVVVELIHFHSALLPEVARPYYWLGASLLAASLVTLTAYRARIWLLVPLVPLVQANAAWAVMDAAGSGVAWWPVLTVALVALWWESPRADREWRRVYRTSAVLMALFLLVFSYWLPAKNAYTMPATWGACAVLVAGLGLRHGWTSLGPVAIALLALAAAWGLPVGWWPPAWLLIAAGTLVFTEIIARDTDLLPALARDHALALELATALALVLAAAAALLARGGSFVGAEVSPLVTLLALAVSGNLLIMTGGRRAVPAATHAGLWLLAAAWADLYTLAFGDPDVYGIWLGLLAALVLLVERLQLSTRRRKRKTVQSMRAALVDWPLADLALGLSLVITLWIGFTALAQVAQQPQIMVAAAGIVCGIWLVAGLLYRLPVLMHLALWIAPLPYALLLVWLLPPLRTRPALGVAWQALALVYLVLGHTLHRMRPALQAPFFVAGYGLLGLGLVAAAVNPALLIATLTVLVLAGFVTSVIVAVEAHPAWDVLVARIAPPDTRPYAYAHIRHAFVFLTAWLLAVWVQVMLGATAFSVAQQGIVVVLLAGAWIAVGRLLGRLPNVVGWPVYAAGWFLWLIGLLQVFFYPAEAMVTAVIGLALSAEALYRSKAYHWMPVFVLQMLFCVLQVALMLDLPGRGLLLAVALGLSVAGMAFDRVTSCGKPAVAQQSARVTALMGAGFTLLLALTGLNAATSLALIGLAGAALAFYRRWEFLGALWVALALETVLLRLGSDWRVLLGLGLGQLTLGAALIAALRPRDLRTLRRVLFATRDWASPWLWGGMLTLAAGLVAGHGAAPGSAYLWACVAAGVWLGVLVSWLHIPRGPYAALALWAWAALLWAQQIEVLPYDTAPHAIACYAVVLASAAALAQLPALVATRQRIPFRRARWIVWWVRPLLGASVFAWSVGAIALLQARTLYAADPLAGVVGLLLLGAAVVCVYVRTGRVFWLLLALGLGWLAWRDLLAALALDAVQWQSVPVGVALLVLARVVPRFDPEVSEGAALLVLLGGAAADLSPAGVAVTVAGLALYLAALASYGWLARCIVPVASVGVITAGGATAALVWINPWFVPLAGGVILLAGALLLEVQGARIQHLITLGRAHFGFAEPASTCAPGHDAARMIAYRMWRRAGVTPESPESQL